MDRPGLLEVKTRKESGTATIHLIYPDSRLCQEDLDHFFFPFLGEGATVKNGVEKDLHDVSLARMIIHKHGGKIHLARERENRIRMTITLPLEREQTSGEGMK